MRDATLFVAVLLWMILSPTAEAASNQDMERVRDVIAGLMRSWNVHDMHAFADLFTEDASFVNVNGSWLQTRAQIEESHKVVHASIFKNSRADIARLVSRNLTWQSCKQDGRSPEIHEERKRGIM